MRRQTLDTNITIAIALFTFFSVMASFAQFKAANLQAAATRLSLMPKIDARSVVYQRGEGNNSYTDQNIEIHASGGPLYNAKIEKITWLSFQRQQKIFFKQELADYFHAEYITGRSEGEIAKIQGYRNHHNFKRVADWAQNSLGWNIEVQGPMTLLKVGYHDALNEFHQKFILIDQQRDTYLSAKEGEKLWSSMRKELSEQTTVALCDLVDHPKRNVSLNLWRSKIPQL